MRQPGTPSNEGARQQALDRTRLIEKGSDTRFDNLTEIARHALSVPIVLVTLVDRDRQWFKSIQGLDVTETGRDISFCGHAVNADEPLIVNDAADDPRFADNPLVTGAPYIRFYAGIPLREASGYPLGTLCIIDREPRHLTGAELESLRSLARLAEELILQDQFQEHNARQLALQKQQELEQTNRALSLLNHIAFDLKGGISDQIQRALVLGKDYLGMEIAIVSEVDNQTYTVRWCDVPPGVDLEPGQTFNLGDTYCDLVMRHDGEIAINHMRQSIFHNHPCYAAFSLESYLGTHLQGEDHVLGTVNFSSPFPRTPFNESERLFIRLLSRWIATRMAVLDDIRARSKLEAMKSQFIATVSHELRTPLTSISGSLKLLKSGTAGTLPPKAQSLTEVAERNSSRLSQLINDLLDMEKLISGKLRVRSQVQALKPIVDEAMVTNRDLGLHNEVTIDCTTGVPDLLVDVDAQRLIQALSNLLSNAVKFSPRGATVQIRMAEEEGYVNIAVEDSGPGVPRDFRDQLFQRFAQADGTDTRRQPGTGLGLAITRELMEQMAGAVSYRAAPEQGSIFTLTLPVVQRAEGDA